MRRKWALAAVTAVAVTGLSAACGASEPGPADSPAGRCLAEHGFALVGNDSIATYRGPDGQYVNLARFDGLAQPIDQGDLDAYRAAGCL